MRIGRFLIHPGWVTPAPGERCAVRIDPGMAFGTGLHPTTRLCLEELDRELPRESVLDVGCGTGILALAAARAGVNRVVALDNDPEACRVARESAQANGLLERVQILECEVDRVAGSFSLVLANILSGPLVSMAALLCARLEPGGVLVLSGLLSGEAGDVTAAYVAAGVEPVRRRESGEWGLLSFVRRR
jgi:ribosomal protein L11 methyltransferase